MWSASGYSVSTSGTILMDFSIVVLMPKEYLSMNNYRLFADIRYPLSIYSYLMHSYRFCFYCGLFPAAARPASSGQAVFPVSLQVFGA
jgi:hypothetical protein